MKKLLLICLILFFAGCTVGPDYVKPSVTVPAKFKEGGKHWQVARPNDACARGPWWEVFHDKQLNQLENKLHISNQTIATAFAQYQQASALVDQARASYFPLVTGSISITRQGRGSTNTDTLTTAPDGTVITPSNSSGPFTNHTTLLNASWEPDLWGSVRRSVEGSRAGAEASLAQLALARLSAESSLAQYYFELRGLDQDQRLLNDTVLAYKKSLKLTKNRYASGVAAKADVVQAESQLQSAEALAINNGINRARYEHAIAILIGEPPANFSIPKEIYSLHVPNIPLEVPSVLLERRPDIASAERLMAQANAQIGVAIAAYFPTLTLAASGSVTELGYAHWFSIPALSWSLGPELAATFFDGGYRKAAIAAASANYQATVATYRQTVLTAFQDVEDNLASLRILSKQAIVQDQAAQSARTALQLVINQYKAGTVDYTSVITAQTNAYNAERSALDVKYLRMTSAVGLIKALGGGWSLL